MLYYLYVKTHNVTGLKYLGQTTRDPFNYKGSGKRWLNHLEIHGNDVTTEILIETEDKNKIKVEGIKYSSLYDVVNNPSWANLVPEEGSGGDTSSSENYKTGIMNRSYEYKKDAEYIKRVSESVKKTWGQKKSSPGYEEYRKYCSTKSAEMWAKRGFSEEDRQKWSETMTNYYKEHPEHREKISNAAKDAWQKISKIYEVTFPDGHIETVKCLRGWCEEKKLPYYKIYNTLRYKKPSKDGWKVRIINE
jgi:hypothetical protein